MKTLKGNLNQIAKDFPYMKFELEANFDINPDEEIECDACSGSGEYVDEYDDVCDCYDCDGRGYHYQDSDYVYDDVTEYVANNMPKDALDNITYAQAYNDQSVNMEYTFTIKTEYAHLVPDVIKTFLSYTEHYDTENAGFHISVLTDSEGVYPCRQDFDREKIENFKENVTKLLPALLYSGSNKTTRGLYYRQPRIGYSRDRYNCITIYNGSLEYRLFDPIYDNLDKFPEYIKVIANTLKYYSKRKLKAKLYDKFEVDTGRYSSGKFNLDALYDTLDNYVALRNTLPIVNPDEQITFKTFNEKKLLRKKYQDEIRAIKQFQQYLEQRSEYLTKQMKDDWLSYKKHKAQAERLSDLTKITAREYLDIQDSRVYLPSYLTGRDELSAEQFVRIAKDELYNNGLQTLDQFREINKSNKLTITG